MICVLVEGVAGAGSRELGLEGLNELGSDALLHLYPGVGQAHLSAVYLDVELRLGDCLFEISVLEDDGGRLATEFEDHLLQVGTRRLLLDQFAGLA